MDAWEDFSSVCELLFHHSSLVSGWSSIRWTQIGNLHHDMRSITYLYTHTRRVWATWRRFLFSPGIDLGREFQCFLIFRSSWTLSLARHSHILHLTRHTAAVIESVFITSPSLDEDLSPTFDHQHDDHNTTRISFHIFIFLLSFFSIFIKSDNREGIGQTNSTDFFLFLDNQLPLHDSLSVSMDIYWCSSGLAGRKGVKSS